MILRDLLISCRPKTDDFWCSQSWRIFYSWILWFDILKKSIVNDARQTTYHLCLSFLIRLRLVVKNQSYFEMMFTVIANHQKCLIWTFTPRCITESLCWFWARKFKSSKMRLFEYFSNFVKYFLTVLFICKLWLLVKKNFLKNVLVFLKISFFSDGNSWLNFITWLPNATFISTWQKGCVARTITMI